MSSKKASDLLKEFNHLFAEVYEAGVRAGFSFAQDNAEIWETDGWHKCNPYDLLK